MLSNKQVLIVDDNEDIKWLMSESLKDIARIELASSAEEAFEHLERADFDLLLIDVGMPHENGFQFLKELRDKGIETPAIFVSAHAEPSYQGRAKILGADYVVKPFDVNLLRRKVAEALR